MYSYAAVGNTVIPIKPFKKKKRKNRIFVLPLILDMSGLVGWWDEVNMK